MTVVVKLGSTLVVDGRGRVQRSLLRARAAEVAELIRGGERVCVVSSGAIALGLAELGLERRPKSTPQLQAASAVGQARLQAAWAAAFAPLRTAQVLLSAGDVAERSSYVNLRNAFDALFRLGVVPVVNENDATATDEITFGDNDALAAHTALLVRARLLVLLTEVEGVYSEHPATEGATLLAEGDAVGGAVIGPSTGPGRGGMASKIAAAQLAAGSGVPTVVASGRGADGARPDRGGRASRARASAPTRAATAPGGSGSGTRSRRQAGSSSTPGRARRSSRTGAACLPWASSAARGRSCRATRSSSPARTAPSSRRASRARAPRSCAGRPRGLEAVHRDRLVVY